MKIPLQGSILLLHASKFYSTKVVISAATAAKYCKAVTKPRNSKNDETP
jgi:hypothetical protein